jgi:hypothetical protein
LLHFAPKSSPEVQNNRPQNQQNSQRNNTTTPNRSSNTQTDAVHDFDSLERLLSERQDQINKQAQLVNSLMNEYKNIKEIEANISYR